MDTKSYSSMPTSSVKVKGQSPWSFKVKPHFLFNSYINPASLKNIAWGLPTMTLGTYLDFRVFATFTAFLKRSQRDPELAFITNLALNLRTQINES